MQNRNLSISQDMNRIFDLKGESTDFVSEIIQPVIKIFSPCNIVRNGASTASGSLSVYTTPQDKDFYLTCASFGISKDAVSDISSGGKGLNAFIEGVSRSIIILPVLTLTAEHDQITINFQPPIKIDRNTSISSNITTTVGSCVRTISIVGYTQETTK